MFRQTETETKLSPDNIDPETIDELSISESGSRLYLEYEGEVIPVPNKTEYRLLYMAGLYDLLNGAGGRMDLTEIGDLDTDTTFAIEPTENNRRYNIWHQDGPKIHTPSERADELLNAVDQIVNHGETDAFASFYEELYESQVRRRIMNGVLLQHNPIPHARVQIKDRGWLIGGLFLLTWDGVPFIRTQDLSEGSYIGGSKYTENKDQLALISLETEIEADDEPEDIVVSEGAVREDCSPIPPEESSIDASSVRDGEVIVRLQPHELSFLYKADWLLNFRENVDDEIYWEQIEEYVMTEMAEMANQADA